MEIRKVGENVWEIPKEGEMNVPALIYSSEKLLADARRDKTLEQARNVACLPGI
jgi:tRNA-splicing ligase RtcB